MLMNFSIGEWGKKIFPQVSLFFLYLTHLLDLEGSDKKKNQI